MDPFLILVDNGDGHFAILLANATGEERVAFNIDRDVIEGFD